MIFQQECDRLKQYLKRPCERPKCKNKAKYKSRFCSSACKRLYINNRANLAKGLLERECKNCGFRYHPYGESGTESFKPDYCSIRCQNPAPPPKLAIPAYVPPPPRNYFRNYNYHSSQSKFHPWLIAAREAFSLHDAKIESEGNS